MARTSSDPAYLSATEALSAFQKRTLSPLDVLEAQIKRIEAHGKALNILTYTFFERARKQARASEALYGKKGRTPRPLEGLTIGIKDWHSVKGEITTYGSKVFRDFRPDQSAPTVERMLEAGAIMHIRTTTPEFAHSGVTHSPLWGVSRNPWNTSYSPGGSSGGAGAALAAGFTTLADGTDGGGSIRIPASVNGVYGFKAPFGRNPLDREHPGEWLLHYGGLARSVADSALIQNVISGPHPADIYSLRDRVELPKRFTSVKRLRVALSIDLGYFEVSEPVRKNTEKMARLLRSLGCSVSSVALGWDKSIEDAWTVRWEALFWALSGDLLTKSRQDLDPYVVKILERGKEHSLSRFYGVNKVRYEAYQKLAKVFDRFDVLICPTTALPSVPADRTNEDPLSINGKPVTPYTGWFMTYPFNLLSQCPVMSAPSGFCPQTGVPTGLQIVGRTYDDLTVYRVAAALEPETSPWAKGKRPTL